MIWTGGRSRPSSFVTSPKCAISGKWRFVMEIGAFSISLAHIGSMPQRTAASGNTPIPSNRLPSRSAVILSASLSLDGQNALKGGGGDPEPLSNGDVVLHGLGDGMTAHRVVAKSAHLRFRHTAKTALAPLLLLFPQNLRFCGSPELSGSRGVTCRKHILWRRRFNFQGAQGDSPLNR